MSIKRDIDTAGLIVKACEKGYGDITLCGLGFEMSAIKGVLCEANPECDKLLKSLNFGSSFTLPGVISKNSLDLALRYFGGGEVSITDKNILSVLEAGLYFKENALIKPANDYVLEYCSEKLIKQLIPIVGSQNCSKIPEVKSKVDNYIITNAYKLFESGEINDYSIESLLYILSTPGVIVKSELNVLTVVSTYISKNITKKASEKKEDKWNELLTKINWLRIEKNKISENIKNAIGEDIIDKMIKESSKGKEILRKYSPDVKSGNKTLDEIIIKYYCQDDKINIEKEDIEKLKKEKLGSKLNDLLSNEEQQENLKLIIVVLIVLEKMEIFTIDKSIKSKLLFKILNDYSKIEKDNFIKNNFPMSLISFLNDNFSMNTIIELDGIEMFISTLQSVESLTEEEITAINSFISTLDKDNNSKVKAEIKKYKVNELLSGKGSSSSSAPKAPSIKSSGTALPDAKKGSPKKTSSAASSPTKIEDTENIVSYYSSPTKIPGLVKKAAVLSTLHKNTKLLPFNENCSEDVIAEFKRNDTAMKHLEMILVAIFSEMGIDYSINGGIVRIRDKTQKLFLNNSANVNVFYQACLSVKTFYGINSFRKLSFSCGKVFRDDRTITIPREVKFVFNQLNIRLE